MITPLAKLVRYELLSSVPVAQHGQGAIWKAKDLLFDTQVALKEIRADLANDITAVESFRKEAAAGARLGRESANIIKVLDYGAIEGVLYFSMPWITGNNLGTQCGRLSLQQTKSIARQIGNALRCAHRNGVVHSDIAPANVLHDSTNDVYMLSDFGYLKIVDSILLSRGHTSMLVGGRTYYLPPEHLVAPERINAATDVYAFALTLHMLLTNQPLAADPKTRRAIPGVVNVRWESRVAPAEVRHILERFVEGWTETDTIDDIMRYVERVP